LKGCDYYKQLLFSRINLGNKIDNEENKSDNYMYDIDQVFAGISLLTKGTKVIIHKNFINLMIK